ncbi:hypothetical protein [Aquimarina intermedia]|uniref:LTXXQ motif family protein n=1 Tax=Aquimarina intermedia TaxID=350814 RepID=A0A5S5C9S6_9FLAO|nr:hypothetical protein [Aquimarina intermedia]TYP75252.1 hypothetical protein BD809_103316 [Aquimarina intermedia]
MKTLFTGILIFLAVQTYSQNPYTQNSDAEMEAHAKELADWYNDELGFTETQWLQFERKVEEHLINEKKIRNSQLSIKEKIAALKENYYAETQGMNDILTQPQMEVYRRVKQNYQKIAPVVVDSTNY